MCSGTVYAMRYIANYSKTQPYPSVLRLVSYGEQSLVLALLACYCVLFQVLAGMTSQTANSGKVTVFPTQCDIVSNVYLTSLFVTAYEYKVQL